MIVVPPLVVFLLIVALGLLIAGLEQAAKVLALIAVVLVLVGWLA